MIRLIIFLMFLFLLWVLFASGMERRRKIIVSVAAVLVCALVTWFDGYDKREVSNLIRADEIVSCGVAAQHSYRSNFDVDLCFENTAAKGSLSRLAMAVIASRCDDAGECQEIQRVDRDILLEIAAGDKASIQQNLSFDAVDPEATGLSWSVEVLATRARR